VRIFLAGGSGVVGRTLIPLLCDAGHTVVATTRTPEKTSILADLGAQPVLVDVFDEAAVRAAVQAARPDSIVHHLTDLAAGDSTTNARLRTTGTRNLVAAARAADVDNMIAASIAWIYESGPRPADEDQPLDPDNTEPRRTTIDGVRALEDSVLDLAGGIVLTLGLLYGPGTWYARDGHFGHAARAGRLQPTESVASFLHVEDAAAATAEALHWPAGVVNVVDDDPAAGTDWVPVFCTALGAPVTPATGTLHLRRPVSNRRAHRLGLTLRYPSWRQGFATL